jgi:PD-(D/E)XK nuclease superfamily
MSLFSRLLKLHAGITPLEDFFTELVAHLFSTNKEILSAWLKYLDLPEIDADFDAATVSTQRTFKGLPHHDSDSRPDFVIELANGNQRNIIFIESKIGSQENYRQLPKYAEVLDAHPGFQNSLLVYITRDFEPKDRGCIFEQIPNSSVRFKQVRWHQFYQFLTAQVETMLTEEIIKFMQIHQMAQNNQFSSIDVIALSNFTKSLKLMDQTMWGEVSQQFKKVLGSIAQQSTTLTQFRLHGRYLMYSWLPNGWWCGLGFMLNTSTSTDYPTVYLTLEVQPSSPHRVAIIEAMKGICKQPDWKGYELDDKSAWSRIWLERSLQSFLGEEDQVIAIQKFFLEALDDLTEIKKQYPELPWAAVTAVPVNPTIANVDDDEILS